MTLPSDRGASQDPGDATRHVAGIGLGTVQFGLDYGITNNAGRVAPEVVDELLKLAGDRGVEVLDTAAAYGEAESVLGGSRASVGFRVVSKVLVPRHSNAAEALERATRSSLARLRRDHVHGLLLHRAEDLLERPEEVSAGLRRLVDLGLVERVGVSAYTPDVLSACAEHLDLGMVQVPSNVLDQRFVVDGVLAELRKSGCQIHTRSALLQGVLAADATQLPASLAGLRAPVEEFARRAAGVGVSPAQLAVAHALRAQGVEVVVVGATTPVELAELLSARDLATDPVLDDLDLSDLAVHDLSLVDPSRW